jgi:hypothetical protein
MPADTGDLALAAELTFTAEVVLVTYDEPTAWPPFRWKRWPGALRRSGYRRVRRGFVFRPRTLKQLMTDQLAFQLLAATYADDGAAFLTACASVITDEVAVIYLPASALKVLDETYRRVNGLPAAEAVTPPEDESTVSFDAVIRRLERAPFNLAREQILDLTCRQISARLSEWGEEKLNEVTARETI